MPAPSLHSHSGAKHDRAGPRPEPAGETQRREVKRIFRHFARIENESVVGWSIWWTAAPSYRQVVQRSSCTPIALSLPNQSFQRSFRSCNSRIAIKLVRFKVLDSLATFSFFFFFIDIPLDRRKNRSTEGCFTTVTGFCSCTYRSLRTVLVRSSLNQSTFRRSMRIEKCRRLNQTTHGR